MEIKIRQSVTLFSRDVDYSAVSEIAKEAIFAKQAIEISQYLSQNTSINQCHHTESLWEETHNLLGICKN